MVGAVGAAVNAVVGQIQRCEHYDTVAVKIFFDLLGKFVDLLIFFLDGTGKQDRGLTVGKSFAFLCFLDDGVNEFHIFFVLVRIGEGL